jgi:hypothetical protein
MTDPESYVFAEVAAAPGAPLLFLFHGTGGDENDFIGVGRQLLPEAHLIAPRGDVSEGGALRFFRRTGEGVYDMADLARATQKMTRFIAEHVARASGEPQAEVRNAFRAAHQMLEGDAAYFGSVPAIKGRIEEGLRADPAYLVHEYLNAHSHPFAHADVARELDGARLSFAASVNIADDLVNLAAPAALQPMIQAARDRTWKETLLDYASNKLFRRDVFVRGRNVLSPLERSTLLGSMRFTLLTPPETVGFKFPIPIGQLTGTSTLYQPLVDALAEGPRSYAELAGLPQLARAKEDAILQAITLLVGGRYIHPVPETAADGASALAFNRAILARTAFDEFPAHLASAAAGAGVRVDFAELLALRAVAEGEDDPAGVARCGWAMMARTGMRLMKEGEILPDQAGNEAELAARVAAFKAEKLPLFQRLGVA